MRSSKVCSTSFTSAGEALSVRRARGRPWPSAMPMILVPLPRLVFPTKRPLFWPEQTFRPQSILSNPIHLPLADVAPAPTVSFPSLRNGPNSGNADAPSGMRHIAVADPATALRSLRSTVRLQMLCVDHSMVAHDHLHARRLLAGCYPRVSTALRLIASTHIVRYP